jgi:hypothetical protein
MDAEMDSEATALTNSLDRSAGGGGDILRDVGMSNNKFTSLGSGSALTDSINLDDVQSGKILWFGTTSGTSTVYTLAPSPSINAYDTGMVFYFKVDQASGDDPTINISAKGAKSLKWVDYADGSTYTIKSDDLETGVFYKGLYDGTNVIVLNFSKSIATSTVKGYSLLPKKITLANGTDTEHDIDFGGGTFIFDDETGQTSVSALTKQLDASWSAGDDAGGLDTGSIAVDTWYYSYAIYNPTTNTSDYLFSASSSSPTLPSDYTKKRRIGAPFLTNGSGNILNGIWMGAKSRLFQYTTPLLDISVTNLGTSATTYTLDYVPTGSKMMVRGNVLGGASGGGDVYVSDPDTTDLAPSTSVAPLSTQRSTTNGVVDSGQLNVITNTSAQIRARSSDSNSTFRVVVISYEDINLE